MQARTVDIDLVAYVAQRRTLRGRYLRMWDAVGDVEVQVDGAPVMLMQKGMGLPFAVPFSEVSFRSATAQTIRVVVADERVDDSRFNVSGAVEVIDGGVQRSRDHRSFSGYARVLPVTGQYQAVQIFNPVGSYRRVIISRITIAATASVEVGMGFTSVPFVGAQSAVWDVFQLASGSGGGAAAAAIRGRSDPVSLVSVVSGIAWLGLGGSIFPVFEYRFPSPIIIEEGNGVNVFGASQNTGLAATFDFTEEMTI